MPKAYPLEFRRDVVAVARKTDAPTAKIAKAVSYDNVGNHTAPT